MGVPLRLSCMPAGGKASHGVRAGAVARSYVFACGEEPCALEDAACVVSFRCAQVQSGPAGWRICGVPRPRPEVLSLGGSGVRRLRCLAFRGRMPQMRPNLSTTQLRTSGWTTIWTSLRRGPSKRMLIACRQCVSWPMPPPRSINARRQVLGLRFSACLAQDKRRRVAFHKQELPGAGKTAPAWAQSHQDVKHMKQIQLENVVQPSMRAELHVLMEFESPS